MLWLTKFKTDPLNLVGPNVSKAPIREIDLSGTVFSFSCPPQTAEVPGFSDGNTFDINIAPTIDIGENKTKDASVIIYSSGWEFYDRAIMGKDYGGVNLNIVLLKNSVARKSKNSLFNKPNMEAWLLESEECIYGCLNKTMLDNQEEYVNTITPESSFWQYPKSTEDIQWLTLNNHNWVRYEIFQPERTPSIEFAAAISH